MKLLHVRLQELEAALKPLADIPLWRDTYPDAKWDDVFYGGRLTVEHVRAARAALEQSARQEK